MIQVDIFLRTLIFESLEVVGQPLAVKQVVEKFQKADKRDESRLEFY